MYNNNYCYIRKCLYLLEIHTELDKGNRFSFKILQQRKETKFKKC